MPKIICTRPNASLLISGVNFTPLEDGTGIISEEISEEAAELFLSIDGYERAADAPAPVAQTPKKAPATKSSGKAAKAAPAAPEPTQPQEPEQQPAADAGAADPVDPTMF